MKGTQVDKSLKKINMGNGERVVTQGLLRSDGRWTMWEVGNDPEYLRETKAWLESAALSPSYELLNDGGEVAFSRHFEFSRNIRGLVYMDQDPLQGIN